MRQLITDTMAESIRRALQAQRHQHRGVGHGAERKNHCARGQRLDLLGEVAVARAYFRGQRTIRRRNALDRIGNPAANQAQSVSGAAGYGARSEAVAVQRLVEKNSRKIARERTPGAVGTVLSGRKPDDQEPRARWAERCHRSGMIAGTLRSDALEVASKAPATAARFRETRQGSRHLS